MKNVKNVMDIMSMPRTTDEQVVQLKKFSCDTSSMNPHKKNFNSKEPITASMRSGSKTAKKI